MPTLRINKSDSQCGECGNRRVSPSTIQCDRCEAVFTHVGSDYMGFEKQIMSLRPDLHPDFFDPNWYKTEEGQAELWELNYDPNQGEDDGR